MVSAVGLETRLISIAIDAARAGACQKLFADLPNVTVLHGDWHLRVNLTGCIGELRRQPSDANRIGLGVVEIDNHIPR